MFDLLDKLLDATVVINERGIVEFWNIAAENKFQFKREEVLGKNIKFLMPKAVADTHDAFIKRYLDTMQGASLPIHMFVLTKLTFTRNSAYHRCGS